MTLKNITVWDLSTRLFHWLLVVLVVFLWYSADIADDMMELHVLAGEALLALLFFRVVWGIWGSQTARFSCFISSPVQVFHYFSALRKNKTDNRIGHNPAGGYMVVLMMVLLVVQVVSGLGNSDDIFIEGRLYPYLDDIITSWMAAIHYYNFYGLLALIAIHLIAILSYYCKGNNLVLAMITGTKKVPVTINPPTIRSSWWALTIIVCIAVAMYVGINFGLN